MGNMKNNYAISIMLIAFLLAGCGTPAGNNGYITPQQISEPKIAEITPTFEIQVERVNNCDGTNPTYNVSYKTIEAQKATFEVTVGAGGLVTGTPVPTALEVQLEAKITAALAKDYGLTTEKNHDLTLDNPQGTFLEHTIEWKVTRVKGLIEVIYGDGIAQVIFDKIANVELHNRTSQSLGCNGVSQLPASTNTSVVPIATLETEPPPTKVSQSPTQPSSGSEMTPIREHYSVQVGTGIFENGTFSDGLAPYSESWLWDNNHFKIQRIRREEQPSGCDVSRYNTNLVWISGSSGMEFTVNGEVVGTYQAADDAHGYIFEYPIKMGDKLCAVKFKPIGFSIILGPDIYYHYDSYCYRGNC